MLVSGINTGKSQDDATSCTHEIEEVFHTGGTGESAAAVLVTAEVNQLARSMRKNQLARSPFPPFSCYNYSQ